MNKENCVICGRCFSTDGLNDIHHLIPRSRGGKHSERIFIHRICHDKIHSLWTETELAREYHTVERILANEQIQAFVKWIAKMPPEFYVKTKSTNSKKFR